MKTNQLLYFSQLQTQMLTKGPLIYLLTFPSGHRYVGQTTRTFEERMKAHKNSVKAVRGCRLVKAAVKKYGWNSVKTEILVLCDIDQLDEYETQFIKLYGTMAPNGYNLETGGHGNKIIAESSRKLMSEAQKRRDNRPFRKSEETKNLPKFIGRVNREFSNGYKIARHPKCLHKDFCDKTKTLEENLQDAKDFLARLDAGEVEVIPRPKKTLPKGIGKEKYGYRVNMYYIGIGRYSKVFGSRELTKEQNYNLAIEHLKIAPRKLLKKAIDKQIVKLEEIQESIKRNLKTLDQMESAIDRLRKMFND